MGDRELLLLGQHLQVAQSAVFEERKRGEDFVREFEKSPAFVGTVFKFMQLSDSAASPELKQLAAVVFKNFVRRNWYDTEHASNPRHLISAENRDNIKNHLVNFMLEAPPAIRAVLGDAVFFISAEDFPHHWPSLLPDMARHLTSGSVEKAIAILEIGDSIFMRYRSEHLNAENSMEVKLILSHLSRPLLEVFSSFIALLQQNLSKGPVLDSILKVITLIGNVFISLASLDIPEQFQDTIGEWMPRYISLLSIDNSLSSIRFEDVPGSVEQTQATVCEIAALLVNKYEEDVKAYVGTLVDQVWNLLTRLGSEERYDLVIIKGIEFLSSVAKKTWNRGMFENPETLKQISERVILPNIQLRDVDKETFEINGLEYIRRELEGSDMYTRRRISTDLVRILSIQFEEILSPILLGYIKTLLSQYALSQDWAAKDTAMALMLAVSVEGSTAKQGATKLNPRVDVLDFFNNHVLPELTSSDVSTNPILKADCLKFVLTFRGFLSPENCVALLPLLEKFLLHDSFVVHSFAAVTIELILSWKDFPSKTSKISQTALRPHAQKLLGALFGILNNPDSTENEYVMKAIFQVLKSAKGDVSGYATEVLEALLGTLRRIADNPRIPVFNHFVFECIVTVINDVCSENPSAISSFESGLFPVIQEILNKDSIFQEFGPYAFQVLAEILHKQQRTSPIFNSLFPSLLVPAYWENKANATGLVQLLRVYLTREGFAKTLPVDELQRLLGVFQKLISSVVNDTLGMELLITIVRFVEWDHLSKFFRSILQLILERAQNSLTNKFGQYVALFLSDFALVRSCDILVSTFDSIQPGLFGMVLEKLWITQGNNIGNSRYREVFCLGLASALATCDVLLSHQYSPMIPRILTAIVEVSGKAKASVVVDDDAEIKLEMMQASGYASSYSRLSSVQPIEMYPADSFAGRLKDSLLNFSSKSPKTFNAAGPELSIDIRNRLALLMQ